MKKLLSILTSVSLAGCSVVGIRSANEPVYQILKDEGQIQVRQYPALVVAETEIGSDYKTSSSEGFQRLAGYIFGKNKTQEKLAMTAPVTQEKASTTLDMTAPVFQQKSAGKWRMAFVLPQEYTMATAPIPLDPAVIIKEIPAKKVAALTYSGSLSEQGIIENATTLTEWLSNQPNKALSQPRSAAYDPPWTLPFLRRNEIHIDIE
ncbi:MAG: heme-binding protein [Methylicorpusculum sp.]|uniref:SOUL family heme-binding protein n=1 Tax=Methylicorpusculum sp. TaxID=2713644 RepID=UPI002728E031|nr:heme-binding protein [Methylicorpusculum sp.]MDO8938613.1 heme-binding protein [Methylicorpusculum sp.]MDP2203628.1 heme-binding protein [Methylicorpusculum sp.]